MARVKFVTGLQDAYNALSSTDYDTNTLYFITDSQRLYKGNVLIANVSEGNVVFTTTEPEFDTSDTGVLYVYTDTSGSTSILVKGESSMVTVSGGEVQDGAITSISAFDPDVITTSEGLSSGVLPDSDTKIPTSAAVLDAINTAIQGVTDDITALGDPFTGASVAPAEDSSGTVLTLTRASGTNPVEVTIADLFLTNATYNTETHILSLYVGESDEPVEVDLTGIIGNSFSDVVVGEDETFTVELGDGVSLGGYTTGDQISANTSLETIIKKLLMKQVPPTYTNPSLSIANNGGTASGNIEIGTQVTPNIRATFNQNDAGALTSIQFTKNSSSVGEAQSSSPATYTEAAFTLESTTTFAAMAAYAEGPVKNDNLGQPYPTGHIEEGSVNSSNYTFTPYRQGYFIGSTTNTDPITSDIIRGLQQKRNGAYAATSVTYTAPAGTARIIIACPAENTGMTQVINNTAFGADVTDTFSETQVNVEGANGYTAVSYNVWSYVPLSPYGNSVELTITLG